MWWLLQLKLRTSRSKTMPASFKDPQRDRMSKERSHLGTEKEVEASALHICPPAGCPAWPEWMKRYEPALWREGRQSRAGQCGVPTAGQPRFLLPRWAGTLRDDLPQAAKGRYWTDSAGAVLQRATAHLNSHERTAGTDFRKREERRNSTINLL